MWSAGTKSTLYWKLIKKQTGGKKIRKQAEGKNKNQGKRKHFENQTEWSVGNTDGNEDQTGGINLADTDTLPTQRGKSHGFSVRSCPVGSIGKTFFRLGKFIWMPCQVKTTTQNVGEDFGRPVESETRQRKGKHQIDGDKVMYCVIIVSFPLRFLVTQTRWVIKCNSEH